MSVVLRNQLDAARNATEQLLRVDHPRAMLCRDVEDLLVTLVDLVGRLNRWSDWWRSEIDKGQLRYGDDDAKEIESLYRSLDETFARASGLVRGVRQAGYDVEGATAFEAAWKELRTVTSFSRDRVETAVAQARNGQTRELGDFLNELQD